MNRREFLNKIYKTSGIVGLCGIGMTIKQAKAFAGGMIINPYSVASGSVGAGSIGQITHTTTKDGYGNQAYFGAFVTTNPGAVGFGHVYVTEYSGDEITLVLYNSSGVVLAYGSVTPPSNTAAWQNVTLNTTVNIAAATTYYCGLNVSVTGNFYTNTSGTGNTDREIITYSSTPANVTIPGEDYAANDMSILFNNTAGSPE